MLDTNNISGDDLRGSNQSVLVAMQIQLGEIKGILGTIVTEHARRITDQEGNTRQLRYDLEAVKTEAKKDVTDLSARITDVISAAKDEGGKTLARITESLVTNKNNIAEVRADLAEVKDRNNSATGRVTSILAVVVAGASILWQVIAK